MCNSYLKIKTYCFLVFAACCILSASPAVAQTYFNDFEGTVGPEWNWSSSPAPIPTDTTPEGARKFLGQFCNDTVSLSLSSVPACNVTVSFDLFIIQSWDGNGDHCCGPDIFDVSVGVEPPLLHTTFANVPADDTEQAYPDSYPGGLNTARSGAVENNSLGYTFHGDSVYNLSFTFAHAGGDLVLNFSASGLQGVWDESWGLDNVLVIREIEVPVDIKPGSCPNPLNVKSKGVLPVAVLGTEDFDVTIIDPGTVGLSREGVEDEEGKPIIVSPLRWAYEDVATPFEGELCDCHTLGADGYLDLTLKFSTTELVEKLKLDEVAGQTVRLILTGNDQLGTILGKDCVKVLQPQGQGPKKKK